MLHPLIRLVVSQPQLLSDHAEAYVDLFSQEACGLVARLKRQLVLGGAGVVLGGLGLVLAGVALLLWAVTPDSALRAAWLLWLVPLVPLLASALCLGMARQGASAAGFASIRQQIAADAAMLRDAAAARSGSAEAKTATT